MRVKVTAELTIHYNGQSYGPGAEFDIAPQDLPQIGDLVAIILKTPEPAAEPEAEENTTELTIAEIKTILDGHGIEYSKRARRAELLALLTE